MLADDSAPTLAFRDVAAFTAWLEQHHDHGPGVWLRLARAGSGVRSLTSDEAVDVGLCFGWISGQRKALDDRFYLQKYVPRRTRSRWSLVNVRKVDELTAAGRMRPSGMAEVAAARADGRWDAAYASQREATVPDDLAAALAERPAAAAAFEAMGRTQRYAVLLDLLTARTPETRSRRLERALHALESAG